MTEMHEPHRGSDVEAWIKRTRDKYSRYWPDNLDYHSWTVLDQMLDDYRLRADTGRSMAGDVE